MNDNYIYRVIMDYKNIKKKDLSDPNFNVDLLVKFLENNYYKSSVYFDESIELDIDYNRHVNNEKMKINDCVLYKDYYLKVKELYEKLKLRLISELKINKTFVNLLHLVRFFELESIKLVNENDLISIMREFDYEYDKKNLYSRLGFYRHDDYYSALYICPENIENCINQFNHNSKLYSLYNNYLLEKVFNHEYGHHVFLFNGYLNKLLLPLPNRTICEKQANYFASFVAFGVYDKLIAHMCKHQSIEYHDPMLYTKYATEYTDFDNSHIRNLYIRDLKLNSTMNNTKLLSRSEIAKQALIDAYNNNKLKPSDIINLKDNDFCHDHFKFRIGYSLLKKTLPLNPNESKRYQKTTVNKINLFNNSYYFSNDFSKIKLQLFLDYINNL